MELTQTQVYVVTFFLGLSTLLANSGLGWLKGVWWMWFLHALNAVAWQIYISITGQWGLTLLNVVTIVVSTLSGVRAYRKSHENPS